jgi:MFS family permease
VVGICTTVLQEFTLNFQRSAGHVSRLDIAPVHRAPHWRNGGSDRLVETFVERSYHQSKPPPHRTEDDILMHKAEKSDVATFLRVREEDSPTAPRWKRNLAVCIFGSFTTIASMTLVVPFLPLYVEQLGIQGQASIAEWSGACFAAAFFTAGLVAPLWGKLADRYGRKLMLIRASLGMAVGMSLMGMVGNVWQFFGLRLFIGFLGGYAAGAMVLVATQSPKNRSGWALGMLSSGVMAGNLVGPLVGGLLPQRIGIRETFYLVASVIFVAFLATVFLIRENPHQPSKESATQNGAPSSADGRIVALMLGLGLLTVLANMSVEPIITMYVGQIVKEPGQVTFVAGLVMSAAALGSILSASPLGKLADSTNHWIVIAASMALAACVLVPQGYVSEAWQLIGLRFAMGLGLGGLLPCITSVLRHSVPDRIAGSVLGYLVSSQFAGLVVGPLLGGFVGGHLGMRAVFLATALLLGLGAAGTWAMTPEEIKRPRQR